MKVGIFNTSDYSGGASRATYRIHKSLLEQDVESRVFCNIKNTSDWTVEGPRSLIEKGSGILRAQIGGLLSRLMSSDNPILHSAAILPSRWPTFINSSELDIVHLNWINAEMMSISDIAKISKPIIWTLHDMWAFCGAEHIAYDDVWKNGYKYVDSSRYRMRIDFNKWTWERKKKQWKQVIDIVCPSHWMAGLASESELMHNWPITVIPNPIDTQFWEPVDKAFCRKMFRLGSDRKIILFGAFEGNEEYHKGFDLLLKAINQLKSYKNITLIVLGQDKPKEHSGIDTPILYIDKLNDDISLKLLYSAADLLVIPSRVDNLPNMGVEAMSCGTPVVAFDTCGLPDIITHKKTGYLAEAFDPYSLAEGIKWVLKSQLKGNRTLSTNARSYALNTYSYDIISIKYINKYKETIDRFNNSSEKT